MDTLLYWVSVTLNAMAPRGFIMTKAYLFSFLEMTHFIGLCLLFGSLIVVDLRVIGFAKSVPINLISATLFMIGVSDRDLMNIAFWSKIGMTAFAGLNTAYFARRIKPQLNARTASQDLTKDAQAVAWLSLALWTSVIILGRFIPYGEDL